MPEVLFYGIERNFYYILAVLFAESDGIFLLPMEGEAEFKAAALNLKGHIEGYGVKVVHHIVSQTNYRQLVLAVGLKIAAYVLRKNRNLCFYICADNAWVADVFLMDISHNMTPLILLDKFIIDLLLF